LIWVCLTECAIRRSELYSTIPQMWQGKPETTTDGTGASIGPPHRSHALFAEAVVSK
jgi:hypothetical protein